VCVCVCVPLCVCVCDGESCEQWLEALPPQLPLWAPPLSSQRLRLAGPALQSKEEKKPDFAGFLTRTCSAHCKETPLPARCVLCCFYQETLHDGEIANLDVSVVRDNNELGQTETFHRRPDCIMDHEAAVEMGMERPDLFGLRAVSKITSWRDCECSRYQRRAPMRLGAGAAEDWRSDKEIFPKDDVDGLRRVGGSQRGSKKWNFQKRSDTERMIHQVGGSLAKSSIDHLQWMRAAE